MEQSPEAWGVRFSYLKRGGNAAYKDLKDFESDINANYYGHSINRISTVAWPNKEDAFFIDGYVTFRKSADADNFRYWLNQKSCTDDDKVPRSPFSTVERYQSSSIEKGGTAPEDWVSARRQKTERAIRSLEAKAEEERRKQEEAAKRQQREREEKAKEPFIVDGTAAAYK